MALIIEDGTNVAGANSFNTDVELVAYAAARSFELPVTESERDVLQIQAMDFITSNEDDMQGHRITSDQELSFPRSGVVVNGFAIASTEIPSTLKKAQNEASIAAYTQSLIVNESVSNVQSEKVDVLATSYFKNGSKTTVKLDRVYNYLSPILIATNKLTRS